MKSKHFFVSLLLITSWCYAVPEKNLWDIWLPFDFSSKATIDHHIYNSWLKKYVKTYKGATFVAYDKVSLEDVKRLNSYLYYLQSLKISQYNRHEQEAYWVNLYNARTIATILEKYPVRSIRDITYRVGLFSGLLSPGPWQHKLMNVEGNDLSLDDIEHRILRPIWQDPRLHYALNCAAMSCPNLRALAFTGANIEALLDTSTKEFVNSTKGVKIEDNKVLVSEIYHWYRKDFGGAGRPILTHIEKYASDDLRIKLKKFTTYTTMPYDWRLNDYLRAEITKDIK